MLLRHPTARLGTPDKRHHHSLTRLGTYANGGTLKDLLEQVARAAPLSIRFESFAVVIDEVTK